MVNPSKEHPGKKPHVSVAAASVAAACCALAIPAMSTAANAGTITADWTGSAFTISPTSLAASAGDTFTVNYGTTTDGFMYQAFYNGTGQFTMAAPNGLGGFDTISCQGNPVAGLDVSSAMYCGSGNAGTSRVFTVVQPGTMELWNLNIPPGSPSTLGTKQGDITIVASTPSAPTTTPASAPAPPPPTAQLLRAPTTQNTRQSNRIGCSQVSVPLQLDKIGRYTFIYETASGQSSSARESGRTGGRVAWNKGSTLGKRKLNKVSTAPVLVTTEANKRLVVNGLIKKAQAKNLRLRVIHTAADGTLTQDVFNA